MPLFYFRQGDEILMVNNTPLVNRKHQVAIDEFAALKVDEQINFVSFTLLFYTIIS